MNYLANESYLAIKPEATPGTPVKPTIFIPLVSEDVKTVVNYQADKRMKGMAWKSDDLLRGNRSHEGTIVVLGDPDTLGHLLNMVMTKGSTTGSAGDGYTHPFTVGDGKSYTFEIKKGAYSQRYFGVKIDELTIEFKDGQMEVSLAIKATGQFSIASLGVALTGSGMTEAVFDDTYDIAPTRGLVAGDVINVGGVDLTLLTVEADGVTVTFASSDVTASIGDAVTLKPQTVTLGTFSDPFYFGNMIVGFGADIAEAIGNTADRADAKMVHEMKIVLKSNLLAQNGTNRMDPYQILPRTKEAQLEIKQLFAGAEQRQAWLDRKQQAISIVGLGKFIKSDFTTQEKVTFNFPNVKLTDNDNKIEVGEYILDDQKFEVLYDSAEAMAMEVELINKTADTAY